MTLLRVSIAFLISVVSTLGLFSFMRFVTTGSRGPVARPVEKVEIFPKLVPSPGIEIVRRPPIEPVKPVRERIVPVVHVVDPDQNDLIDFDSDDLRWPSPSRKEAFPGDRTHERGTGRGDEGSPAIDSRVADREALPLVRVDPTYPQAAASRGVEGWVHLRFTIAADGTVVDAVVVEASDAIFEKSALQAVAKWRYRPSMVGGVVVDTPNQQVLLRFRRPA